MATKFRGVMQSPVTPLKDGFSLDLNTFERVLDFHVRPLAPAAQVRPADALANLPALRAEPRGW